MSALTEALDRLRRDVRWAEPATGRLALFDVAASRWIYGPHVGTREEAPEELPDEGYVLRLNDEEFELDTLSREEAFLVEVTGIVQDVITTEIGEAWPELADGGVLTPGLDNLGRASWLADGHAVCEIGTMWTLYEDDEEDSADAADVDSAAGR